jgi:hypothetical protein
LPNQFDLSSSGKTIIIASTEGNVSIPKRDEKMMPLATGLPVCLYLPRRVKTKMKKSMNNPRSFYLAIIALGLLMALGCSSSNSGDNSCDFVDDPDCSQPYDPSVEEEQLGTPEADLEDNPSSTSTIAADVMDGHRTSTSAGYNIWGNTGSAGAKDGNCHNAANRDDLGIVVCFGDPTLANPDPDDMAGYHTFNWAYQADKAVFWNWSGDGQGSTDPARVMEFSLPANYDRSVAPDMQSVRFSKAGKWGCGEGSGGQWVPRGTRGVPAGLETRALPLGSKVEEPNREVCKVHTGLFPPAPAQTARSKCLECCTVRAVKWDPKQWNATYQSDFLSQCNTECNTL